MEVQQVDITGPRLDGKNPLKDETRLTIRGAGEPLKEAMVQQQGGLVVSIIMVMDQDRKKIRGSYYSIHGTFVDTVRASKVINISSQCWKHNTSINDDWCI